MVAYTDEYGNVVAIRQKDWLDLIIEQEDRSGGTMHSLLVKAMKLNKDSPCKNPQERANRTFEYVQKRRQIKQEVIYEQDNQTM